MYAIPDMATGTPYMESVNMPMGSTSGYRSRIIPSTTRFVLVPISVHVPPKMDAKSQICASQPPIHGKIKTQENAVRRRNGIA